MKRSDVVTVVLAGELGKPRPAVIIQSNLFDATGTVVILPITSTLTNLALFRMLLNPDSANGLRVPSDVMIDKITHLKREKVGRVIGQLDDATMQALTRQLATFLSLS